MEWLAPLFPVTVVAAVVLFVAREVVEDIKRRRANVRKGRAFRTLLARECELNHWAHKRLTEALLKIQEAFRDGVAADYKIKQPRSGDLVFRQEYEGRLAAEFSLPDVRDELMGNIMLDVAILDQLFACLEAAYDSVITMRHVRDSLITFIERDDDDELKRFFRAFPEYGLRELEEALQSIRKLYKECTGEDLTRSRIR